ncbi:MAG: hypothetical protein P1U49_09085 [Minwuia sp.]|nr:hypothetical protein [Minwuia sp.]
MRSFLQPVAALMLMGLASCQTTTGIPEAREVRVTTAIAGATPLRIELDGNYCLVPRGRYANDFEGQIWAAFDAAEGSWRKVAYFITCYDYQAIQSSVIQALAAEGEVSVFMPNGVPKRFEGSRATYIEAIIRAWDDRDVLDEGNESQRKLEEFFARKGRHKSRRLEGDATVELVESDAYAAYFRLPYRHVLSGSSRDLVQIFGKTVVDGLQVQVAFTTDRSVEAEIRALDVVKRLIYGLLDEEASI